MAGIDRRILTATDPAQVGRLLDLHGSDVLRGRGWEGEVTEGGVGSVVAHAPVMAADDPTVTGEPVTVIGVVAVGANTPGLWQSLEGAVPKLLTYLGVASLLGVVGSLLLARRVKRRRSAWSRGRSPGWPSTGTRCSMGSRRASSASTPSTA